VENKMEIMWHVLKTQEIYLLPRYTKWIYRGCFPLCIRICERMSSKGKYWFITVKYVYDMMDVQIKVY